MFCLLLVLSFSSQPEDIFVDQAVFRLAGQVYFLSDIKAKQKALKVLECANSELLLNQFLGEKVQKLTQYSWNKRSLVQASVEAELAPYISLEKLKLNSLSSGKETLRISELLDLGKKCTKIKWTNLDTEQRALFLSEVYLRDRFKSRSNSNESIREYKRNLHKKEKHEVLDFKPSSHLLEKIKEKSNEGL